MSSDSKLISDKMNNESSVVVWDHGHLTVEANLTDRPICGFTLVNTELDYVYQGALKTQNGKHSMQTESEFLRLEALKVELDNIDFPKVKCSSKLLKALETIIARYDMNGTEYFITKDEQVELITTQLTYHGVCQVFVPSESCMRGMEIFRYIFTHGVGLSQSEREGLVRPGEQVRSFRKRAIIITLNKFALISKESIKGLEDTLTTYPTPEVLLTVLCQVFRANRQQQYLRKWVLSKLSSEDRYLFKEHMILNNFMSMLKYISAKNAFSDFEATMIPLVSGESIELPKLSENRDRLPAAIALMERGIEVKNTLERFFQLYDDRSLLGLYQFTAMNKFKRGFRMLAQNIPGMSGSKFQELIAEKNFVDSLDTMDRNLTFYYDMLKLQTYIYAEVKMYDDDKRKQREELTKVTPKVTLRHFKLSLPKTVKPEDAAVFKLLSSKVNSIISGRAYKHGLSPKEWDLLTKYKDIPLIVEAEKLKQDGKLVLKKPVSNRINGKTDIQEDLSKSLEKKHRRFQVELQNVEEGGEDLNDYESCDSDE